MVHLIRIFTKTPEQKRLTHLLESGWKNRDCDQTKFTENGFLQGFL